MRRVQFLSRNSFGTKDRLRRGGTGSKLYEDFVPPLRPSGLIVHEPRLTTGAVLWQALRAWRFSGMSFATGTGLTVDCKAVVGDFHVHVRNPGENFLSDVGEDHAFRAKSPAILE